MGTKNPATFRPSAKLTAQALENLVFGLKRRLFPPLPAAPPEKLTFSCCGVSDLLPRLRAGGRSAVVLCGIEIVIRSDFSAWPAQPGSTSGVRLEAGTPAAFVPNA